MLHSDELRAHLKSAPKPTRKVSAESCSDSASSSSSSDSDDSGLLSVLHCPSISLSDVPSTDSTQFLPKLKISVTLSFLKPKNGFCLPANPVFHFEFRRENFK